MKPTEKDVKVDRFPNKFAHKGIENMRKRYERFFKNMLDIHCKIRNSMVSKNKVLDYELVTAKGTEFKTVSVFEVKNGKIVSVTFM